MSTWKHNSNVVVINGGWNPAILLDSNWLKRYLFPSEEVSVSIPPMPVLIPTVTTSQVVISLRGQQLCFAPTKPEASLLDSIENVIIEIVNYLPHTPVRAMGINFLFDIEDSVKQNVCGSEILRSEFEKIGCIQEENHKYSLMTSDRNNINIDIRYYPDKRYTCELNFHHTLNCIEEIKRVFAETHIANYRDKAKVIMSDLLSKLEQGIM